MASFSGKFGSIVIKTTTKNGIVQDGAIDSDLDLEASEPAFEPTRRSERVLLNNISKEHASLEEKEPEMAKK